MKLAHFSPWPFGRTIVKDPTASRLGTIGAVLWIIPGVLIAVGCVMSGVLTRVTVIGIPFGIQAIKMPGLALQPFGKKIAKTSNLAEFYTGAATAV